MYYTGSSQGAVKKNVYFIFYFFPYSINDRFISSKTGGRFFYIYWRDFVLPSDPLGGKSVIEMLKKK